MANKNTTLDIVKACKEDEFYTQLSDIEKIRVKICVL